MEMDFWVYFKSFSWSFLEQMKYEGMKFEFIVNFSYKNQTKLFLLIITY